MRYIIDCCSLLNLYTGWKSLRPLAELNISLHVCENVLKEILYVNEFALDGSKIKLAVDVCSLQSEFSYIVVRPESSDEINDYVDFSVEIDDGEAQSLAIAKHRQLILLSDDRKALILAKREDICVHASTTTNMLRLWGEISENNAKQLPEVLHRISNLARFRPRVGSTERDWWDSVSGLV